MFKELSEVDNDIYCEFLKKKFDEDTVCSFLAYRKHSNPSCFITKNPNWEETKIAYILFIEYKKYIAICKRNVSISAPLKKKIEKIKYTTLSNFLLAEASSSSFTKMAMKNLDMSENAMRSKVFESDNLEKSFSPYSTSLYTITSFRTCIKNNTSYTNTYSIALQNSRINKLGEKQNYSNVVEWAKSCIDRIIKYEHPVSKKKGQCLKQIFYHILQNQ